MDFIFYLALFFFVLIFGTLDSEIDFDFWARLIVGKSYFQTGELFTNDFYSYGTTHEFIDHEWGSSLIFYLIQNNFGDIGLYIFKSIIVFLTLFLITKTIRLEDKNIKLHFLFFFFALHSICYNIFSTIRCQTFSFFFFVLFFYILKYAKTKQNYRILWCLPVLNIIWANIHGGFVMGLALIAIFALGEFLNNKKSKFPTYLSFCFLASCLTTLINPYGIKYVYFIFEAFKLNRIHITEWQSVFFDKHYIFSMIKFKIFFIITLLFFLISNIVRLIKTPIKEYLQKIDKTKYLILLFCILISLKAQRCHVFFTYSVLILCYCDFYKIFNKTLPKFVDNLKEIVLMVLLGISCIYKIQQFNFENKVINKDYPIYCVEFIKQNNLKGNVFTMFHTGSYVAYKLYPNNHVFMDGRYEEVYDNNLINEMGNFFLAKEPEKFLKKYHNDILILDKFYPITDILKNNKNWFLAYEDEQHALFLNSKYKNKKLIQPTKEQKYYNQTKFETSIDWLK